MSTTLASDDLKYKEAILKYASLYNSKKQRSKQEKLFLDETKTYVIYARKSTEDEARQKQSKENQIEKCKEFAEMHNLEVADVLEEDKSAKTEGRRPVFNEMIETLKKGTSYNSILAWHPDRLSRNMKESGEILDMLDKGTILDLKFPSYSFNNDTAGKMTLSMLFAMAKEFSDKLSDDTIRGIEKKITRGKYCGTKKRGYLVDLDDNYIPNPKTFDHYQRAWQLYLNGKNQHEISKWLKQFDIKIDRTTISNFFQDPFYAGIYCFGNITQELLPVNNTFVPMISTKDFIQVQRLNREKQRGFHTTEHFRPFNDFIICSECGKPMVSGLSTGNVDKYLKVSCSTKSCIEHRRAENIKPIQNTINGKTITEFAVRFIREGIIIDEETYNKTKSQYITDNSKVITDNDEQLKIYKSQKTRKETKRKEIKEKFYELDSKEISSHDISKDLTDIKKDIALLNKNISELEGINKEIQFRMELEFPEYEVFVNTFEDMATTIESSEDIYLIDQTVRLVFLNLTAREKKVSNYTLSADYKTVEGIDIKLGVGDRT